MEEEDGGRGGGLGGSPFGLVDQVYTFYANRLVITKDYLNGWKSISSEPKFDTFS